MAVRHKAVVQRDFRGRERPYAHFRNGFTNLQTVEGPFDKENRKFPALPRAGEDSEEIRYRRGCDPHFLALEPIAAVHFLRRCSDATEIAARIRFGHADSADLFAS